MSDQQVDNGKRTWLIASGCAGVFGGAAVAVPFVSTFQPSERARAAGAPVEVDISALRPGEKLTVEWRGKPVWIIKRTPEQLAALVKIEYRTSDGRFDLEAEKDKGEAPEDTPDIVVGSFDEAFSGAAASVFVSGLNGAPITFS